MLESVPAVRVECANFRASRAEPRQSPASYAEIELGSELHSSSVAHGELARQRLLRVEDLLQECYRRAVIDLDSEAPFAGRYRIVRRIASGGMGAVFEVVHTETHRSRALKVMLPELVSNGELRDRFQMEARVTAHVDSEYIVDVFDAGIDADTGMPFLVMELLKGEELGEVLRRTGSIEPNDAIVYLRQVASALDKTHAAAIVHRDLKPENLFLTHREDGTPRIKILDFGISKVISEASTGVNATRSLGTPLYMAPEQVLGQPVAASTDLYSLGLMAYTMLVGVSYWKADTEKFDNAIAFALHTTKGATESAVLRAARLGRALPESFDAWFRRATHLEPAQRFQRASELVNELAALLGIAGVAPVAASPPVARVVQTGVPAVSALGSAPPASAWDQTLGESAAGTVPTWGAATSPPSKPRARVIWPVGGGALVAVGVAFAVYLKKPAPAAPPLQEASAVGAAAAPASPVPSVAAAPQEEVKPAASPSASPPATEVASAPAAPVSSASRAHAGAAMPAKVSTPQAAPVAASPKGNCDPNFYLDAQGDKHFKPECFGVHSHK